MEKHDPLPGYLSSPTGLDASEYALSLQPHQPSASAMPSLADSQLSSLLAAQAGQSSLALQQALAMQQAQMAVPTLVQPKEGNFPPPDLLHHPSPSSHPPLLLLSCLLHPVVRT